MTLFLSLLIVLLLLLAAGAVLLVRAIRFVPPPREPASAEDLQVDTDRAVQHLQAMIRCRTISQAELRDEAEFEKFRALLPEFYPRLFARASVERVDSTGVLIHLTGREPGAPAVLLGHYDVVPVNQEAWEKPAFAGILEDGVLWGRGTLDMKNQLCCMLEGIETLLAQGFTPRHDLWFALSGEEEIMGPSAASMRDVLKNAGIRPAFVLDEGGDIMDGVFPGTDVPCAMVGIGEKGSANLYFTASGAGGHSSTPFYGNPLSDLCKAMTIMEKHPWPVRPGSALNKMVDTMGRYCSFRTRLLLANRDILRPLYHRWIVRQHGMIEAGARTTWALTQARGSAAGNVIPPEAEMFVNVRVMHGDTHEKVIDRARKYIGADIRIHEHVNGSEACPDSLMTAGWTELKAAIEATWPEAVVTPYQMVAGTDSRHWREICDNVYRFSGKQVTNEEKSTVHGNNERIRTVNTENAIKFFIRLLEQC